MNRSVLDYYSKHSQITDPGRYAYLFDNLPTDIDGLCRVVQGLHMHINEGPMYDITIPEERFPESDLRTVPDMLERILELDDRPLSVERPPERRLVGCCRDFSVMLCALLRHQGIPARVRFGFSLYFRPDFACDHVICEYWRADEHRWAMVDAQQDERHREMNRLTFDPYDLPRDRFLLAGRAWPMCRGGIINERYIGYGDNNAGLWVIRTYLVHDLAALTEREMQISDMWGACKKGAEDASSEDELALLDQVARLTTSDHATVEELEQIYRQNAELQITPVLLRYLHGRGFSEATVSIS